MPAGWSSGLSSSLACLLVSKRHIDQCYLYNHNLKPTLKPRLQPRRGHGLK